MKATLSPRYKQLCLAIGLMICAVALLLGVVERRGCAQGCTQYPSQDPRDFAWRQGARVIVNINPNSISPTRKKKPSNAGSRCGKGPTGRTGTTPA